MKKIATLSAEDVMRSWIRAELKSSRFKKNIKSSLNLSNLESLNFRQLKSVLSSYRKDDDPRVVSESILKSINNDSEELEPIISIKLSAAEPVIIEGHARSIAYCWYSETNPNHKIKLIIGEPSDKFPEDFSSRGYNLQEIREYFLNSRR